MKTNSLMKIFFTLLLLLNFTACVKKNAMQDGSSRIENPPVADLIHKVSFQGETLALIANWYTGKTTNWKIIKDANPNLKPERMYLGQEIVIPGNLVSRREPLPKKFLQDMAAKKKLTPEGTPVDPLVVGQQGSTTVNTTTTNDSFKVENSPNIQQDQGKVDAVVNEANTAAQAAATDAAAKIESANQATETAVKQAAEAQAAASEQKIDHPANSDAEREKLLDELLTQ